MKEIKAYVHASRIADVIRRAEGLDGALQSAPSLLRYVGPHIDIANCLTSQCVIKWMSEMDDRTKQIVEMLSTRVTSGASGCQLTS